MAHFTDDPFLDSGNSGTPTLFPMESDAAFSVTPLVAHPSALSPTGGDEATEKTNTTFIQDQLNIQRSSSGIKGHASALSRQLSIKSNGSYEVSQPAISGLITTPENPSRESRGRVNEYITRGDSHTSLVDTVNQCSLSKSSSERSMKSVHSMQAIGTHSFGTLRVHSPSPTRDPNIKGSEHLKAGDVVVVRDIPKDVIFGYDTVSFVIKQPGVFEGVKNLPPGAHLIWAGTSNGSLRTGFWLMSSKLASDQFGDVIVKRWDNYNEALVEEASLAEARIQANNLFEFADKLQSYTVKQGEGLKDPSIWAQLTSSIKAAFLNKVTGHKEWNHWQVSSSHDVKQGHSVQRDNARDFGNDKVLGFVFPKDRRTFSSKSTGRERTEQAIDTSAHVVAIIARLCSYEDSDEIIGELQFSYITGMLLGNVACMEQWAHIIKVTFRAFRLVMDLPGFYHKFIKAVHAQVIGIEGSIFDSDDNLEDDFKSLLVIFKSRLDEQLLEAATHLTQDQKAVGDAFADLESFLWKWRGGWDLRGNFVRSGQVQLEDGEFVDAVSTEFEAEDERGEFAPQMVELDEDGREKGRISF
ncbi:AAR2 protein [Diplocarpon rosae]|nr:AAR2 protein [Diplocarpon rosae]